MRSLSAGLALVLVGGCSPSVPWERVTDEVFEGVDIGRVWGAGEDIWVTVNRLDPPATQVVHFDGADWRRMEGEFPEIRRMWASSPDDLWLAGDELWHWDGAGWSSVDLAPALGGGSYEQGGVMGSGPDDVWVSVYTEGIEFDVSHALRYDGQTWTEAHEFTPMSTDNPDDYIGAGAVCANGPDDVWFGAILGTDSIEPPRAYYRWNGVEWMVMEMPGWVSHSHFCAGERPWSLSGNEFENDTLSRPAGDGWISAEPPVNGGRDYIKFAALWVSSANEAWIAGTQGERDPIRNRRGQVWRYADDEWIETIEPGGILPDLVIDEEDSPGLRGIWQTASGRVFLFGPYGLAWEYQP
jgi:hypothetical protein